MRSEGGREIYEREDDTSSQTGRIVENPYAKADVRAKFHGSKARACETAGKIAGFCVEEKGFPLRRDLYKSHTENGQLKILISRILNVLNRLNSRAPNSGIFRQEDYDFFLRIADAKDDAEISALLNYLRIPSQFMQDLITILKDVLMSDTAAATNSISDHIDRLDIRAGLHRKLSDSLRTGQPGGGGIDAMTLGTEI